jgi:hypothetical protein
MDYFRLFEELYINNVRYLVCGGLAVNIYGIPRMTADVDFEILWKDKVIRKFKDIEMYLASLKHLIIMKQYSNREQDKEDIILLTELLKKQ